MRLILLSNLLLICSFVFSTEYISIRNTFYDVSREKIPIEVFLEELKNMDEPNAPIAQAYKAMGELLLAKESWNPIVKYEQFVKGKKILEAAIAKSPNDIEIVYLRLCTQTALPPILNYKQNISSDSQLLINSYHSITDLDLKSKVKMLLLEYRYCEPKDLAKT